MSESVSHDQLRAFIERVERLDEQLKAINDDKKEIFAEAKGNGFDTKAMKTVLRIRRMDHSERLEQEAVVELYLEALGMASSAMREDDGYREVGTGNATRAPAPATPAHDDDDVQPGTPAVALAAEAPLASAASGEGRLSDGESLSANELSAPIQPETAPELQKAAGETIPTDQPGARAEGSPEIGRNPEPTIRPETANEAPERPARHPADPLRSEAAAREDADTAAPVTEPSTGTPAGEAVATAVASPVSNITPLRSATGLERMPGCQHVDACAGKWNARCGTCEAAWNAAVHDEAATG